MDGPLGLPKNYAAFWLHKGRTKFLFDYKALNYHLFCNMTMGITRFCTKLSDLNIKFCVYLILVEIQYRENMNILFKI